MANSTQRGDPLINDTTPLAFFLSQNYPNPFRGRTRITYCVAYKTRVRIIVSGPTGDALETLVDAIKNPGTYEVDFDVCACPSYPNRHLEHGKHTYRMEAGDYTSEKEMILME